MLRTVAFALAFINAHAMGVAAAPLSWLDAASIVNWNAAGAPVPRAPKTKTPAEDFSRCAAELRVPATAEDRAVTAAGWRLFGPMQLFDGAALVSGLTDLDGMCRPLAFQSFVFVAGRFAGTLSPVTMNSRTDGQLGFVNLFSSNSITAPYERYTASDPLCCPYATTIVTFAITKTENGPLVVPQTSATNKNPS